MTTVKTHKQEKYHHLVEYLQDQIHKGELKAGDRLPTFDEFRQAFGVSLHTVSHALLELEKNGLITRQRGRGVFVAEQDKLAHSLTQRQGIVGLCGWGFGFHWGSSSYWTELMNGIRKQAQTNDSQILLLEDNVQKGWEKVDGVILADRQRSNFLRSVPMEVPLVCLFNIYKNRTCVVANEEAGIKLAVQYLLDLGHKRIAYLYDSAVPLRLESYRDALRHADIEPQSNWCRALSGQNAGDLQFRDAGHKSMNSWLNADSSDHWLHSGCTALLCHNDDVAVGAMQAFNEAGIKVPDDVSVIGFDGTKVGEYSSPQLTTIEMPLQRIGQLAIELLQKQITVDNAPAEHRVLNIQLRVRKSTSAPSQDS